MKQEVMECAVIYVSELWVDNRSGKDIIIKWENKYKGDSKENTPSEIKIKKGEKVKITEKIQAQFYDDPINYVKISVWDKKGKKKSKSTLSEKVLIDESKINENRKGFHYELNR